MKFLGSMFAVVLTVATIAGCSNDQQTSGDIDSEALNTMVQTESQFGDIALGSDPWEVVVCQIPQNTTDPVFAPVPERLNLSSGDIVAKLDPVIDYFSRWSHGRYQPNFTATTGVSINAAEKSDLCVERALDKATPAARGVLVIANAQHSETAVGGWGRPGSPCEKNCSAKLTRRAVYIGAADFMPFWKGFPPLDLVVHEMGHALDWPHSSTSIDNFGNGVYDSEVDVMSNSAAPRDVNPDARNAPGPLGINMYLSQWINDSNVALLEDGTKSFDLVATDTDSAVDGVRLVLVQLNNSTIVSVELLNASGDNQHLLRNRVVVHQIEVAGVVGFERRHTVLDADLHIGESFSQGKIDITVEQITSENSVTSAKIKVLIAS
jgi:hypothetical protein